MKPIVGLYVEMLRQMGITTVMQAKMRITKDDMRHFRIPSKKLQVKYLIPAVKLIEDQNDKTSLKSEPSVSASAINLFRQVFVDEIDARAAQLPDGDPYKEAMMRTRISIEEQIVPSTG